MYKMSIFHFSPLVTMVTVNIYIYINVKYITFIGKSFFLKYPLIINLQQHYFTKC